MTVQQVNVRFATTYSGRGTKQFQRDLNTLSGSIKRVSADAGQEFTRFGRFASAAGTALMVGVGAALAVGIKAAIDFEDAFAGVRKTVDASEGTFLRLARQIRDLSLEIPVAATELARIGELGGQLGVPVEAMDDFIETIAKLGVTTNLEVDDAAQSVARFATIMGSTDDEFENIASSLVELGNNFATQESEILNFATRLAGIGTTIGLTEGEVLGLAAAFTAMGEPAERGATAVQRAFVSMFEAVQQGGVDLRTFAEIAGTTAVEFSDLFEEDPGQAFIMFAEGLGRMVDEGEDVTSVLQDLGLGSQRTLGAMLKAASGFDTIENAMRTGNQAFDENIALSEEAEERFGTMASQIGILKNQFNDLRIEIGDKAAPAFKDLLGFAGGFFDLIKDNMGALQGLLVLVATLAGVKGLIALGRMIGTVLIALGNLGGAFAGAQTAGIRLKDTMGRMAGGANALAGILGIATLALGAIGVAFARNRQHANDYKDAIENLVNVMRDVEDGSARMQDAVEALETVLAQKTGIFDLAIELDDFTELLHSLGMSVHGFAELALTDFEGYEERVDQVTSRLARNVGLTAEEIQATKESGALTLIGRTPEDEAFLDQAALERLSQWLRLTREVSAATEHRRKEEELQRREIELQGRARATAPGGPGAIGMGGPGTDFMESVSQAAQDLAMGIITSQEDYEEALIDMREATTDFGNDFIESWDETIGEFNELLFDWETAWDEYENVEEISTSKLITSMENWVEDQERLVAALGFVYDEFGADAAEFFATLPEDLQRGMAATLAEIGPEEFRRQMETMTGAWGDLLGLALEAALIRAPSGAKEGLAAWETFFETEIPGIMEEHGPKGSKAWMEAVIGEFGHFHGMLMEQSPEVGTALEEMILAAIDQAEKDYPFPIDIQEWTAKMTTPERIQFFVDMGFEYVDAVILAWGTLPERMADVTANAARDAQREWEHIMKHGSPSKVFMEYGKFAAMGFEQGFDQNMDRLSFKPNQPVFKLEPPSQHTADGPSITIVNPQHKDDDIMDGLQRATTLVGLTRMAEVTRN